MRLLTAVNTILRKLGEIDVPSLDEPYPTLAIVLPALDEARTTVLKEGWWFNTLHDWDATPDPDGFVELPENTLMFYPDDAAYVFEGQGIVQAANHDPYIGKPVRGKLIIDKDFERLPYTAAMAVTYTAAVETYTADIGPDDTSKGLDGTRIEYLMTLSAEHTRSRKLNTKHKRSFSKWKRSLRT